VRTTFDELRRPTHLYVKIASGTEFLAQRTLYGEGVTSSKTLNHRTRVYRIYDSAGTLKNVSYDFKGNLIEWNRQLATAHDGRGSHRVDLSYATIEPRRRASL
jgi:hypothetical protein